MESSLNIHSAMYVLYILYIYSQTRLTSKVDVNLILYSTEYEHQKCMGIRKVCHFKKL